MISKNEINKLALKQKVRTTTIDKDWVLGHFIDAIYTVPECNKSKTFISERQDFLTFALLFSKQISCS
jgi:hypothetical protein